MASTSIQANRKPPVDSGRSYFYNNAGELQGDPVDQASSGGDFDAGRGDGTRIAAHIHSPYVFIAGKARTSQIVRVAAWDSQTRTFAAMAEVSEPGLLDAASDRVNIASDALNRVTVAYETKIRPEQEQNQVLTRVLELKPAARRFDALTPSFFAFVNIGDIGFQTLRPTIAMTTKQILVAAKGVINKSNNVAAGPDSHAQTTFYTVFSHPSPMDDPTTPVGGGGPNPTITVSRSGANLSIQSSPQPLPAGWVLQVAESISGPWVDQTGANTPVTVPIDAQAKARFLRAIKR